MATKIGEDKGENEKMQVAKCERRAVLWDISCQHPWNFHWAKLVTIIQLIIREIIIANFIVEKKKTKEITKQK